MTASTNNDQGWKRPFFSIWTGQAFSLLGSQLVQFALIWWLTVRSGSANVLAMASLAGMLPQVILGPFAGVLVDRWNRRRTMILADGLVALATLALAILFALGRAQIWMVYGTLFIRSLAGQFHYTAMAASTTLMVPGKHLTRVAGINQLLGGALGIVAAPMGALLLDVLPLAGVLAIDVGTAVLAIGPLLFVAVPQPLRSDGQAGLTQASFLADLRAGFQYISTWPGAVALLLLSMLLNLLISPTFSLLPLLVRAHFHGEALQLGWINSAEGVGMVAGGLLLGAWGGFRKKIYTSMLGLVGLGVGIGSIGLAPAGQFGLAVAAMFLVGGFLVLANGPIHAILQSVIAPEMQGRVMSLVGSLATLMAPVGLAVAGPLSELTGVRVWYWISGGITLAVGLVGFFLPVLTHIEDQRAPQPAQDSI